MFNKKKTGQLFRRNPPIRSTCEKKGQKNIFLNFFVLLKLLLQENKDNYFLLRTFKQIKS